MEISKETANMLAKKSCNMCKGKGYLNLVNEYMEKRYITCNCVSKALKKYNMKKRPS